MKFVRYVSIYHGESNSSMFKKIIEKMRFGSCKTNTTDNVNTVKECEKKQEGNTK